MDFLCCVLKSSLRSTRIQLGLSKTPFQPRLITHWSWCQLESVYPQGYLAQVIPVRYQWTRQLSDVDMYHICLCTGKKYQCLMFNNVELLLD